MTRIEIAEALTAMLQDHSRCPQPADAVLLQDARDIICDAAVQSANAVSPAVWGHIRKAVKRLAGSLEWLEVAASASGPSTPTMRRALKEAREDAALIALLAGEEKPKPRLRVV